MTDDTLLLRQVNPAWIQQGRITSQVFQPTPKDARKLSVYDGDKITARESWLHFTEQLSFKSDGVMAVTLGECRREELDVRPDPEPFPEHAIIDFTGISAISANRVKKAAKRLRAAAELRGWQYKATV
jgi:hypothetical protein